MKLRWISCALSLVAGACVGYDMEPADRDNEVSSRSAELRHARHGAVFTISNELTGNRVLAFERSPDGELGDQLSYPTGGLGTGDSLGSQAALVLSEDRRFLLVVDAGSNEISSFAVNGAALELRHRVPSGGTRPVSITERRGLVYVVHAGGVNDVRGFALDRRGRLYPLRGANRPLSAEDVGPGQIALSPNGRELVVTEKATSKIAVFRVGPFGRLGPAMIADAAGMTPFGFEFTSRGDIVVSEAASSSASSYGIDRQGLELISGPIPGTQAAPCWVVVSHDNRHAYVANAGSASVSSFSIERTGEIALEDPRAGELEEGGRPLDMALDARGRYLYVLDRGRQEVASFRVARDGSLEPMSAAGELAPFASGLAAY